MHIHPTHHGAAWYVTGRTRAHMHPYAHAPRAHAPRAHATYANAPYAHVPYAHVPYAHVGSWCRKLKPISRSAKGFMISASSVKTVDKNSCEVSYEGLEPWPIAEHATLLSSRLILLSKDQCSSPS